MNNSLTPIHSLELSKNMGFTAYGIICQNADDLAGKVFDNNNSHRSMSHPHNLHQIHNSLCKDCQCMYSLPRKEVRCWHLRSSFLLCLHAVGRLSSPIDSKSFRHRHSQTYRPHFQEA